MVLQKKYNILTFLPLIFSFLTFIYVGLNVDHLHYDLLLLLPFFYFFCFAFFLRKHIKVTSSVFFIVFNIVIFFRYVLLPFFIVFAGYYGGRAMTMPDESSLDYANILMVYELLVTSLVASYFEKRVNVFSNDLSLKLGIRKNIVFLLFVFGVIVFLNLKRDWLFAVNFFVSNPLEIEMTGDVMLGSYLLILIKQIIFVFAVFYFSKRYEQSKRFIYLIFTFIAMALNVGIFVGTNRSDVLVPAIVSLLLVSKLFSHKVAKGIAIVVFFGSFCIDFSNN